MLQISSITFPQWPTCYRLGSYHGDKVKESLKIVKRSQKYLGVGGRALEGTLGLWSLPFSIFVVF